MLKNEKLTELIMQALGDIINKIIIIPNTLISVTKIDCSPDLKNTTIFVSVLPDQYNGTALKKLRKNSSLIRKKLAKKINLRKTPELKWQIKPKEDIKKENELLELEEILEAISRGEI